MGNPILHLSLFLPRVFQLFDKKLQVFMVSESICSGTSLQFLLLLLPEGTGLRVML